MKRVGTPSVYIRRGTARKFVYFSALTGPSIYQITHTKGRAMMMTLHSFFISPLRFLTLGGLFIYLVIYSSHPDLLATHHGWPIRYTLTFKNTVIPKNFEGLRPMNLWKTKR